MDMVIKKYIWAILALGMVANVNAQNSSEGPKTYEMTLEQAIAYGKQNSLLLKNNALDMANANETVKQIKSAGLPRVTAELAYNQWLQVPKNWIPNFVPSPGSPEYIQVAFQQPVGVTGTISASQLIFDGAYLLGLKAAKEFTNISQLLYVKSETDLEYQIAQAYVQAVGVKANLEVLNSNLNTIDSSLRMMRAMYTEGFVEKLDVDKLELGRSNIKTQMDKLEGTIEMLNNVMKMQLGIPMGDNLNLTNSLEELNALISLPELDQEAIKNRIEVQLMNQQLSLSQLDEKRYKVGRYPTVAAFAQHQQNTQRPEFNFFQSNLTPNNNFIPSTLIGVKVTATLFDGLSNRSKIREVVNNRVKMENDLENFKRFASMEFINAKISYYNNIEQWEQQKKNITLAKNIYDRTKVKYTECLGTALEITQAETDLVSANTGYQTAINDVILSKINIKKSLGKKIIE